jgi:alkylhydroperoxidase family enzyme
LTDAELVRKALDDPDTAPITPQVRATLKFLRKMTRTPSDLGPDDAREVLAAGVSKAALAEAIEVAYLFNIYDRLADTMGWDVPAEGDGSYAAAAKNLLSARGYKL